MTREEARNWVMSLKPGQEVILFDRFDRRPVDIVLVKKVTPTGIVRTTGGSFSIPSYGSCVVSYGGYSIGTEIQPFNDEAAAVARAEMERRKAEAERRKKIEIAKVICYKLRYGQIPLTEDVADGIIRLVQEVAE